MAKNSNEELDQRWQEHVKRNGLAWDRLESRVEKFEREGRFMLKKVSYVRNGAGWRIVITATVDDQPVVQFAEVDEIAGSANKLTSLLEKPIWKVDKFAKPAPAVGVEN